MFHFKNSFEELKTTHENLKISHETLNTSWGTLKDKHEELKEAHNSLLAQEVKGKISMGVECNILNISLCATTHLVAQALDLPLVEICLVFLYCWKMNL
jgi:hypothetical protein